MKQRINKMKPVILREFSVSCNECDCYSICNSNYTRYSRSGARGAGQLPGITDVVNAVKSIRHAEDCYATRRWASSEYNISLVMRTVRPGTVHEHV